MDLTCIMFTKHLEGLDVPGIIAALQSVGVQGAGHLSAYRCTRTHDTVTAL